MYSSHTVTQFEDLAIKQDKPNEVADEPIKLDNVTKVKQPMIWRNVIGIGILHCLAIYLFIKYWNKATMATWIFSLAYGFASGLGITAGAHRLWAHKSYSAKLPLRIFLACLYCGAGQTHLSKWIRDHRTHHRFTETPADPHDANRGFFFSHVGWLMMKRHPAVIEYGSKVDMSDIKADPVIQFFDRYFPFIMTLFTFVIPLLVPPYFWNETWEITFAAMLVRYVWILNATFSVNSFAHMWGNRPYNSKVKPTENPIVAIFTLGEGWHNYHHAFPWDYKAAELGAYGLNGSTGFIELMAKFGLAYNLRTPRRETVERQALTKGDGSASYWGNNYHKNH